MLVLGIGRSRKHAHRRPCLKSGSQQLVRQPVDDVAAELVPTVDLLSNVLGPCVEDLREIGSQVGRQVQRIKSRGYVLLVQSAGGDRGTRWWRWGATIAESRGGDGFHAHSEAKAQKLTISTIWPVILAIALRAMFLTRARSSHMVAHVSNARTTPRFSQRFPNRCARLYSSTFSTHELNARPMACWENRAPNLRMRRISAPFSSHARHARHSPALRMRPPSSRSLSPSSSLESHRRNAAYTPRLRNRLANLASTARSSSKSIQQAHARDSPRLSARRMNFATAEHTHAKQAWARRYVGKDLRVRAMLVRSHACQHDQWQRTLVAVPERVEPLVERPHNPRRHHATCEERELLLLLDEVKPAYERPIRSAV